MRSSRIECLSRENAIYSLGALFPNHACYGYWRWSPSAVSSAISVQLRELEVACDPAFTTMVRTLWTSLAQVVGPSVYTSDLVRAAEQVIEAVKPRIEQKKYLRNLFDKAYKCVKTYYHSVGILNFRPALSSRSSLLLWSGVGHWERSERNRYVLYELTAPVR